MPRSRTGWRCSSRVPTCSTSGASPPAPAPPGSPPDEERHRVLPVIGALAEAGAVVSVDTTRAAVASDALAAGATIVNDVSGGLADPAMLRVVARGRRGLRRDALARDPGRDGLAGALRRRGRRGTCRAGAPGWDAAVAAGVAPEQVVLDPGLGFAEAGIGQLAVAGPPGPVDGPRPAGAGSGRGASGPSVTCSPVRTVRRRPRRGTRPLPRSRLWPRLPARGACGSTRWQARQTRCAWRRRLGSLTERGQGQEAAVAERGPDPG